jgi:hypothetical protein
MIRVIATLLWVMPAIASEEPYHAPGTMPNWWCHPKCGGRKIEENVVWQSAFDIKLKHVWDHTRNGCFLTCNITNSTLPKRIFNIRYD